MKITVELNTVEEMEQFLEAWKAKKEPKQEGFPETTIRVPSFDEVTKAAVKLMDAGRQDDLRQLLVKYGVQALPELKDNSVKLAEFYAELEVM